MQVLLFGKITILVPKYERHHHYSP